MLHEDLPGAREKLGETAGWVEKARAEGWYEPDDHVDAVLPFVNRDSAGTTRLARDGHSFQVLLDRYVGELRGLRVLEVGAAKAWGSRSGSSATASTSPPTSSPTRTSVSAGARSTALRPGAGRR